jgi:hypothetical protein
MDHTTAEICEGACQLSLQASAFADPKITTEMSAQMIYSQCEHVLL